MLFFLILLESNLLYRFRRVVITGNIWVVIGSHPLGDTVINHKKRDSSQVVHIDRWLSR